MLQIAIPFDPTVQVKVMTQGLCMQQQTKLQLIQQHIGHINKQLGVQCHVVMENTQVAVHAANQTLARHAINALRELFSYIDKYERLSEDYCQKISESERLLEFCQWYDQNVNDSNEQQIRKELISQMQQIV